MRKVLFLFVAGVVLGLPSSEVAPAQESERPHSKCAYAASPDDELNFELRREIFSRCGDRGVWRFNHCSPIDNGLC